jgi:hypothetical protein
LALSGNLHACRVWRTAVTEHNRKPRHAFSPDQSDLDAVNATLGHHRCDARLTMEMTCLVGAFGFRGRIGAENQPMSNAVATSQNQHWKAPKGADCEDAQ